MTILIIVFVFVCILSIGWNFIQYGENRQKQEYIDTLHIQIDNISKKVAANNMLFKKSSDRMSENMKTTNDKLNEYNLSDEKISEITDDIVRM